MKYGIKNMANFPAFDTPAYNNLIKDLCRWAHKINIKDTDGTSVFKAGYK